ncbi:hypothetical protein BgiMline_022804 [Biomphalaria glabrata]|nr:hypothetical protein BgiMline_010625 [Biomphalaria glabrata]
MYHQASGQFMRLLLLFYNLWKKSLVSAAAIFCCHSSRVGTKELKTMKRTLPESLKSRLEDSSVQHSNTAGHSGQVPRFE